VSSNRKANYYKQSIARQSHRADNVEHLVAEFLDSSSPKKMGTLVLEHTDDYDDEFFEVLADQIARENAHRDFRRVRVLEALRQYLRYVRKRVHAGQTADMWRELAEGAAREEENLKKPA
jgi:hypothetical protein